LTATDRRASILAWPPNNAYLDSSVKN